GRAVVSKHVRIHQSLVRIWEQPKGHMVLEN
ncbi:uncharacterized protein METZ01_LOCUS280976, partial [marine metagenome]